MLYYIIGPVNKIENIFQINKSSNNDNTINFIMPTNCANFNIRNNIINRVERRRLEKRAIIIGDDTY